MRSAVLAIALLAAAASPGPAPTAPRRAVTDEYQGVKVVDEYRWLENGEDPEVTKWMGAQDERARGYLSGLPHAKEIRARVKTLLTATPPEYDFMVERGGRLFAIKVQPPKQQPFLVLLASPDDTVSEKHSSSIRTRSTPRAPRPSTSTSFARREAGRGVALAERQRGRRRPRVRRGDRRRDRGGRSARERRHRRRQPRLERGRDRLLLHALPARQRAAGGGHGLLPAGVVPPAGHEDRGRLVLRGQGVPAHRRDRPRDLRRRKARAGGGRERRRRRVRLLAAWSGRPVDLVRRFEDQVVHAAFGGDGKIYLLSRRNAPNGKVLRLDPATADLSQGRDRRRDAKDASIESVAAHGEPALRRRPRRRTVAASGSSTWRRGRLKRTIPHPAGLDGRPGHAPRRRRRALLATRASRSRRPGSASAAPTALRRRRPCPRRARSTSATPRWCANSRPRRTAPRCRSTSSGERARSSTAPIRRCSGATAATGSASSRVFSPRQPRLARPGRRLRRRQPARRRRVRRGVAPRRQPDEEAERVRRLLACGAWHRRARLHQPDEAGDEGGSNGGLLMGAMLTQHPGALAKAVVSHVGHLRHAAGGAGTPTAPST